MENLSESPQKSKSNQTILEILQFCKDWSLPARVVGKWVWVKFDSKPTTEIRQAMKDIGFRWSKRRGQWSHCCGNPSRPARSYRPWDKYRTRSLETAYTEAREAVQL